MSTSAPAGAAPASSGRKVSISSIFDNPRLPSLPAVALQVVDKASKPDCDLDDLIDLLRQDSGMCGRVLKTVNSGLFALRRPVSSLKQAISLLGIRPLRSLVLGVALPAVQISERDDLILKYWRDSVAGAVIARQLAIQLRRPDPEDDLVAGLLRDLGILVLREAFPDEYRKVWNAASNDWARRQCDEERAVFDLDHTEIGACLIESWNLPPEVFLPIRYHHDPQGLADSPRPIQERGWLLHFASKVAMLDRNAPQAADELLQLARRHFAMDQAALTKFLDSVAPTIAEFAAILNVDIGKSLDFAAILTAGCEELVRLSVESSRPETLAASGMQQAREPLRSAGPLEKTWVSAKPAEAPAGKHIVRPAKSDTLADFDVSCLHSTWTGSFRLNGYEVREVIGRGGMGVVFKAFDPMLNRFAAVKMLTPERMILSEARERFVREARTSAAIQHENIVSIYAVNEVNCLPYIVMEYVPGMSLQDLVDQNGPLALDDVIRYGRQIAAGLHAAHQRRVIHRDIKPANILVTEDGGTIKITDFGLARVLDDSRLSADGMWVGTPMYMAPEQFNGTNVDHRADLFSLGSLLYTLCAGVPPFPGDTPLILMKQVCTTTPTPLRVHRDEVPLWLDSLIARLHAKSPAARLESAAEVVQAFDKQAR